VAFLQSGSPGYSPVTTDILTELQSALDSTRVISEPDAKLQRYGRDRVADTRYAHPPEVVVFPVDTGEVQRVMQIATRERIPVTPRGAGSGLSGGAVPIHGGISLSFEKMNQVIEIDTDNLVAVVEPGVVTNELDSSLADYGLFFAGYPLSEEFCFIGGNVAENAGGGRAVKYGVTSRYVTGLEIVTPAGEVMTIGGKRFKDVTGLDLLRLLTGSEGTLAVFTKIYLRLLPRPGARVIARVSFADELVGLGLVPRIVSDRCVEPSSIEFLDSICLDQTRSYIGEIVDAPSEALLFIELDGSDDQTFENRLSRLKELFAEYGSGVTMQIAGTKHEIDALWKIRKQVPWALKKMNPFLTAEDIVVPIGRSADLLMIIRELSDRFGVAIPFFGHAGDGNYHASPMKPAESSTESWDETLRTLLTELYTRTAELGGTISGEHGIGHKRLKYLPLVLDDAQRALLRRIKQAFDPEGILNPGKLYS
jgi:glycolate oxidase